MQKRLLVVSTLTLLLGRAAWHHEILRTVDS